MQHSLTVSYTETYDLNTRVGKVSVIGFHTPSASTLRRNFGGLMSQFRKIKINSLDIAIAGIAQLPVDPLNVGYEPGQVAPQDLVNPMLFKAVTGDSFNNLIDVIYGTTGQPPELFDGSISEAILNKPGAGSGDPLSAYYNCLSMEGFRKAHPQQGMVINNLVPLVHGVVTTRPFNKSPSSWPQIAGATSFKEFGSVAENALSGSETDKSVTASISDSSTFMSSGSYPMPAMPCWGMMDDPRNDEGILANLEIPKIYVGALVLPPAIQQKMYFRMALTWTVTFSELTQSQNIGSRIFLSSQYWDIMDQNSKKTLNALPVQSESMDTSGTDEPHLITTKVN